MFGIREQRRQRQVVAVDTTKDGNPAEGPLDRGRVVGGREEPLALSQAFRCAQPAAGGSGGLTIALESDQPLAPGCHAAVGGQLGLGLSLLPGGIFWWPK